MPKQKILSMRTRAKGFTLIEVVVSIVLLATLVSGMVVAYSAHHRQALRAVQKRRAIQLADELLYQWYATSDPQVPRSANGSLVYSDPIEGQSAFVWRTEIVSQSLVETVPVEFIRLQIFAVSGRQPAVSIAEPLAQIDVILPIPEDRI